MNSFVLANQYLSLPIAIFFGVFGTIAMKLSDGLQKLWSTLCVIIFYSISFIAMTLALPIIELSVIYAIWSGVGTLLVSIVGVVVFHEAMSYKKFFFLALLIVGIIGIELGDHIPLF